jgi:hypothetical protein
MNWLQDMFGASLNQEITFYVDPHTYRPGFERQCSSVIRAGANNAKPTYLEWRESRTQRWITSIHFRSVGVTILLIFSFYALRVIQ